MTTFSFSIASPAAAGPGAATAPLAHETAHGARALDHLLHQFKDKPRIEELLGELVDMMQTAEDLAWQLAVERGLNAVNGKGPAEGAQLDGLGQIVGEPRSEKGDAEYITFLRVRILVNNSDGKLEDLAKILSLIGFDDIMIHEESPAHLRISVASSVYPTETSRYLRQAKAAGVGLTFVYSTFVSTQTFQASGTYATEEYYDRSGAGSVYDTSIGGRSAGVFA